MINEAKTIEKYGYVSSTLAPSSHKGVVVDCDYCGETIVTTMKRITLGRKDGVHKIACNKCRYIKRKEVSLLRDGVANSAQRQEVRDKIRDASAPRLKSQQYKDQIAQTNLARYGTRSAMQSDIIKKKHKQVILDKYGVDNVMKIKSISRYASKKAVETKIANGTIINVNGKTRPQIAKQVGFSRSHFGKLVKKYGIDTAITMTPHESSLEKDMAQALDSLGLAYQKQVRINGKIADFVIGSSNIIVEADGLYWHSDAAKLSRSYHIDKRQTYIDAGYAPLFFREHEIRDKLPIVKSIIMNKLNKSTKLFARKGELRKVCKKNAVTFLTENHLMGRGAGDSYGLYFDNELISILTIKQKGKALEIGRFCHKLGFTVIGGLSRLLKFAVGNYPDAETLFTFIDLRYGSGDYLPALGFTQEKTYPSFKWTDGFDVYNRMKFPGRSGYDKGLTRIYDCGQGKFSVLCSVFR